MWVPVPSNSRFMPQCKSFTGNTLRFSRRKVVVSIEAEVYPNSANFSYQLSHVWQMDIFAYSVVQAAEDVRLGNTERPPSSCYSTT